jgi:hypothetical protein
MSAGPVRRFGSIGTEDAAADRRAVDGSLSAHLTNLYPLCNDIGGDAECGDPPAVVAGGGGTKGALAKGRPNSPRGNVAQAALNTRMIAGELVVEIDGALSDAQADQLARRHGLARLQSQNFRLSAPPSNCFASPAVAR